MDVFKGLNLRFWQKLVLSSGVCLVLLAAGLMATNYWSALRTGEDIRNRGSAMLEDTNRRFLFSIVTGQADTFDSQLEHTKNVVMIGAQALELALASEQDSAIDDQIFELILAKGGKFATTIFYLPIDGSAKVFVRRERDLRKNSSFSLADAHFLPQFESTYDLQGTMAWSPIHQNPHSIAYDRVIDAVAPIYKNDELTGFLGISVSVIRMARQYNHLQAIRGSYNFLLDNDTQLVASPPLALVDLKPGVEAGMGQDVVDLSGSDNRAFQHMLHAMALGNKDVGKITLPSGDKYMAYRPLVNANLRLGLVVPVELASITTHELSTVISKRSRSALLEMLLVSLPLLGLSLILVALISIRMTRPLKTITEAANQISEGQLDQLISISSRDEIGTLATSFNTMSRQLKAYIYDLNSQQQLLTESEKRFRVLFESSPISLLEKDYSEAKRAIDTIKSDGIESFDAYFTTYPEEVVRLASLISIKEVNHATLTLFQANNKEHFIKNRSALLEGTANQSLKEELIAIAENRTFEIETELLTLGGTPLTLVKRSSIPPGYEQSWEKILISFFDLTDRKRIEEEKNQLESQLRQAYKMEAIGTLAGGIAHDFNNILSAVLGYAELLEASLDKDREEYGFLKNITQAGLRARGLVSQILTFSRLSTPSIERVALDEIIEETVALLRASIPASISIKKHIHSNGYVMADSGQMSQIMLNLCTNSSLAMQKSGGTIEIILDERSGSDIAEATGDGRADTTYIHLSISDTGCGIPPENLDRIFEPFFTTRERDRGTGMGLAVVHGIIKNSEGYLQVQSEIDVGTRISVYLPKAKPALPSDEIVEEPTKVSSGQGESILFVDDETALTNLVKRMLTKLNYTVTVFNSPVEALDHFKKQPGDFDLVITDLTMPEMTGDEMAKTIKTVRSDIPILLCTGFNDLRESGASEEYSQRELLASIGVSGILNKPFTASEINKQVKKILQLG
ncbi:ATP-binding protein [Desulforhopalus sp. 52FAK]